MYQMHVGVGGAGIYGASGGGMQVIVRWYDSAFVYEFACQGMSTTGMTFGPVKMKNDIPGKSENMLMNLEYYKIKITIPTSFVGWGKIVDFTFEVFEEDSSEPIFKTTRRPEADGMCLGGVSVLTVPTLVMQGTWSAVQQKLKEQQDAAAQQALDGIPWVPFI
jgi:hypothetical protein